MVFALHGWASSGYDFLLGMEEGKPDFVPESGPLAATTTTPIGIPLASFYQEFAADGRVTVYLGSGIERWYATLPSNFFQMLESADAELKLGLSHLVYLPGQREIQFQDRLGIRYVLDFGDERDDFIAALKDYEIVFYGGHSRYGRGPAFREFWNYFRMGTVFPSIEMDALSPYFLNEPILQTTQYPVKFAMVDGASYRYQYRGETDESSYLPADAYTKVIEGNAKDLRAAAFLKGRQLFFFHSCSNIQYWKDPFRARFPRPQEKLVFGTTQPSHGDLRAEVALITALVRRFSSSSQALAELNAVEPIFTVY